MASVGTPTFDAAIDSRIVKTELRWCTTEAMEAKKRRTHDLIACMADPARYRRRIFRALPRVLDDIEALRVSLLGVFRDQRTADNYAPILAAAWAVASDTSITQAAGRKWVEGISAELIDTAGEMAEDEDRVIEHILSASLETDDRKKRTVAELLTSVHLTRDGFLADEDTLARHGIRLLDTAKHGRVLAIASRSDALSRILAGTAYETSYDAQLRRHPLCLTPDEAPKVRMGAITPRARWLDWEEFKRAYMGAGEGM